MDKTRKRAAGMTGQMLQNDNDKTAQYGFPSTAAAIP
jgi:hypothetical protein